MDEVSYAVILDMSFCIILIEDNAFLESYMNNILPLFTLTSSDNLLSSAIKCLSSDAHIYISCLIQSMLQCMDKKIFFVHSLHVLTQMARGKCFRFRSEQLHVGSKSNAVKYKAL